MGYNTTVFIKAQDNDQLETLARLVTEESGGYEAAMYARDDWHPGIEPPFVYVHGKWYDVIEDLCRVAERLDATVTVVGWGEDEGNVWVCYCYGDGTTSGKLEATITFPPDQRSQP